MKTLSVCAGTGQDGEYQKGVSVSPRFTDNGDGTVKDNLTGLIWLKNANCFGTRNWTTALNDANTLASGSCGLTDGSVARDWRLPNVREMFSLLQHNAGPTHPLPPGHPFLNYPPSSSLYWTSTTNAGFSQDAWIVYTGDVNGSRKTNAHYVWPVRGGQ